VFVIRAGIEAPVSLYIKLLIQHPTALPTPRPLQGSQGSGAVRSLSLGVVDCKGEGPRRPPARTGFARPLTFPEEWGGLSGAVIPPERRHRRSVQRAASAVSPGFPTVQRSLPGSGF